MPRTSVYSCSAAFVSSVLERLKQPDIGPAVAVLAGGTGSCGQQAWVNRGPCLAALQLHPGALPGWRGHSRAKCWGHCDLTKNPTSRLSGQQEEVRVVSVCSNKQAWDREVMETAVYTVRPE